MALKDFYKKIDKNAALFGIALIAIVAAGILLSSKQGNSFSLGSIFGQSNNEIAKKAIEYINTSGLSGEPVSLVSASEVSGLVKMKIKIGSNEFDSYVTKDGKLLFPQAFDMTQQNQNTQNQNANTQPTEEQKKQAAESIKKSDKPSLAAYVVSRCPYGLQMQRAIADAVKTIPSLAQYVKVLYIGSVSGNTITSMHGDAEAKENLRQICIREEQVDKYWPYVSCQMKSGDVSGCQSSSGVDSNKLDSCISDANRGVAYAKKDFDLAGKYNIQGSPTLVMGDATVSEFNFGGRTSDAVKSLVCAGFNNQPSFCSTKLNTADAATSFSQTYESSNTNSGNSGANGANCAPAQ
jgi:thioredoxin-related protein